MRDVQTLRNALAEWLSANGLEAVTAWGEQARPRPGRALAAVSLRGLKSGEAGFQNYLGERYDRQTGTWEEVYGRSVELTFGLDLSAGTMEELQAGLDLLRDLLDRSGPEGMVLTEFSAGEPGYDRDARRYRCPAQAGFRVWATAVSQSDGTFLDFEVRGEKDT